MGFLKNFFSDNVTWREVNIKLQKDPTAIAKKWIHVYYSIYFSKEHDKHKVEQAAADMTAIINNTKAMFFGQMEEFMGCVNPYLGIDSVLVQKFSQKDVMTIDLEKNFKYSVVELPNQYQIVVQPFKPNSDEIDLYSLERLCFDMYMLGHASDYISKRYPIEVHNITQSTSSPEMISYIPGNGKDVPFISHYIRLLVFRYPVIERFEFQKVKSILDTWLFGGGSMTFSNQINIIRKNQPNSEWTKKVSEMIGDINQK